MSLTQNCQWKRHLNGGNLFPLLRLFHSISIAISSFFSKDAIILFISSNLIQQLSGHFAFYPIIAAKLLHENWKSNYIRSLNRRKKKHWKFSFHQNHILIQTNRHLFIETIECSAEKLIENTFAANFQLECNQDSHKIVFASSSFNEDLTRSKCSRKIF